MPSRLVARRSSIPIRPPGASIAVLRAPAAHRARGASTCSSSPRRACVLQSARPAWMNRQRSHSSLWPLRCSSVRLLIATTTTRADGEMIFWWLALAVLCVVGAPFWRCCRQGAMGVDPHGGPRGRPRGRVRQSACSGDRAHSVYNLIFARSRTSKYEKLGLGASAVLERTLLFW